MKVVFTPSGILCEVYVPQHGNGVHFMVTNLHINKYQMS